MKNLAAALLLLGMVAESASAATTKLSIVINSPASTAINCTINYPSGQSSFAAPIAANSLVATCAVTPSTWSGALTLSGADAGFFALSGTNLDAGAAAITQARAYNVTITATP